jgi:hypothetical protein
MTTSRLPSKLTFLSLICLSMTSCAAGVRLYCPNRIGASIGKYDSVDSGARAAVRRLAKEIHKCPKVKQYSIAWSFPTGPDERPYRALIYSRKDDTSGYVGYEYDPGSGTGETYLVDDSAVDRVASEGGALSDFAKYQKPKEGTGKSTPEGRGEEEFKFQVPSPQR